MQLSETVEFAFRRRYSLPPTDPRFLNATHAEILMDYWAHRHWDDPKLRDEIHNPDFDADLERMEREAMEDEEDWETVAEDRFEE